jgi:hypothetical protein
LADLEKRKLDNMEGRLLTSEECAAYHAEVIEPREQLESWLYCPICYEGFRKAFQSITFKTEYFPSQWTRALHYSASHHGQQPPNENSFLISELITSLSDSPETKEKLYHELRNAHIMAATDRKIWLQRHGGPQTKYDLRFMQEFKVNNNL